MDILDIYLLLTKVLLAVKLVKTLRNSWLCKNRRFQLVLLILSIIRRKILMK